MSEIEPNTQIEVLVVYASAPDSVWVKTVRLCAPASVADALVLSGFEQSFPSIDWRSSGVGLFGHQCAPEQSIDNGARIEVYRPLTFDPMQSRRRRAAHRKAQALAKIKPRVKNKRSGPSDPASPSPLTGIAGKIK
jgi:putative ubiquitin-RnfH superfamily antitoxin RatB of RatAB toxin-antitoxin module